MRRAALIMLAASSALASQARAQHCLPDSLARDTVHAVLSLAPGGEAGGKQAERDTYLLVAQAIADHFVPPSALKFASWPGTFCRRPGNANGVDTDCFGLGGILNFTVDSLGRLTSDAPSATTESVELNRALTAAIAAASAAGDLPVPSKRMWTSKRPLTLAIRSSTDVLTESVPFVRTRMLTVMVDVPPSMKTMSQPRYPPRAEQMGITDRVELEFVIDSTGKPEPNSMMVMDAKYREFVTAAVNSFRESRYNPGMSHGCAVPVLVHTAVSFQLR